MISETDFRIINEEVTAAVDQALERVFTVNPANYVLLLADGEYKPQYASVVPPRSPYVINSMEDKYIDKTRLEFLLQFLRTFYRFPAENPIVDDSPIRLNMELMIYAHIWESRSFLKKLFRIAGIINGSPYEWDVTIPTTNRQHFINRGTKDIFRANNITLGDVMENGFHSSLRNAFAHSEYSIDATKNMIILHNYNGASWELQEISFNDWSRRFCYSFLLNYYLLEKIDVRRTSIIAKFDGSDAFEIDFPRTMPETKRINIFYRPDADAFVFTRS